MTLSLRYGGLAGRHLLFPCALVVCAVAVSSQSFWIDEGGTAFCVAQGSFTKLWDIRGSTLQMPGYLSLLWAWATLFGAGEYALRAFNIPWFLVAAGSLLYVVRLPRPVRRAAAVVLLLSPFAWYYLDEARPYAMQMGCSVWAVCAMYNLLFCCAERSLLPDLVSFLAAGFLLSASSLLAMVMMFLYLLGCGFVLATDRRLREKLAGTGAVRWVVLAFAVPYTLLIGYFLWTLKIGAEASTVGKTGAANVVFALYEMLGFSGLGPSRLELRNSMLDAFAPYLLWLGVAAAAYIAMGGLLAGRLRAVSGMAWRRVAVLASLMGLGVASGYVVGLVGGFRLLGRHLTPLFPLVLLAVGGGIALLWDTRRGRCVSVLFLVVMLMSCLGLRFLPRHKKDDYRSAVAAAERVSAAGGVVWWAADRDTALYYGLALGSPAIVAMAGATEQGLRSMDPPDLVLLSKPDIYDPAHVLATYMEGAAYVRKGEFPAFTLWQRSRATVLK